MAESKPPAPHYIAVSLEGTVATRNVIKRIAAIRGVTSGHLLFEAVKAYCTPEEWAEAEKFFARCVSQSKQETAPVT